MIGRLKDMVRSRDGREWVIRFTTASDFSESFDELYGKDVDVDIKKHSNRRSLDANAYCWVLIGEIAKKLNITKNEVYRKAIIDNGVFTIHCLPDEMIIQACEDWRSFGLGFQVETFPSKNPGCTNAIFYKGSHFYSSAQMHHLISGLIHEAEGLGIPTITPEEEARLIGHWAKRRKENENGEAEPKDESSTISA